jgi:hypothetical protein
MLCLSAGEDYAVTDVQGWTVLAVGIILAIPGAHGSAIFFCNIIKHCNYVAATTALIVRRAIL